MSSAPNDTDPRREPSIFSERDIRPVVARPTRALSGLAIAGIAAATGLLLFAAIEGKRQSAGAPAVSRRPADLRASAEPPPLYLPSAESAPQPDARQAEADPTHQMPFGSPLGAPLRPAPAPPAELGYQPQAQPVSPPPPAASRSVGGGAIVSETGSQNAAREPAKSDAGSALAPPVDTDRAIAGTLANRSTTVPQGTIVPAVLETAFDSTSPGFARAVIQRDVRGFDGTLVLIPRGSHLIGEYGADTSQGQSRAVIAWSRLIRPDGTTIAIGSPAVDPVGRGGIKASVNTHFLDRFAAAILQSSLDVGVNLASRSTSSPVVVALPGATQGIGNAIRPAEIRPTLRVPRGKSISVFVARDLDFTTAEALE